MKLLSASSRRYERQRRLVSAALRYPELKSRRNRTKAIRPRDLLLFATVRNEGDRIAWFLDYYRERGVAHFIIVDNASDDGSAEMLEAQPDVSLWSTTASYKRANFGVHWINALASRHADNHWILVVDPDEYLVYPHCDTRDIPVLTDHLDSIRKPSLGAILIDLYGEGPIGETVCAPGESPIEAAPWFDTANYFFRRDDRYRNIWIQGGPRLRAFFSDQPMFAPALNKTPLVKWRRGQCFVSSTHSLLPRALNVTYDEGDGERLTGALLHAKFLSSIGRKADEELARNQHYAGGREYRAYAESAAKGETLWTPQSARYEDWRQLVGLGLMSRGGWL